MSRIDHLLADDFQPTPFWWRDAPLTPTPGADLPDHSEAAVIGSGYAGLCCALELARGGMQVTVLDAGEIGSGASSRAAGFTSGRASISKFVNLDKEVGPDRAKAILDEADEAYDHFQTTLMSEEIDCDFTLAGRFVGANSPAAYEAQARKLAETRATAAHETWMVPRDDQRAYVGSDLFHGGMWVEGAGLVHPAKYHAGLVRLCLAAGVRLVGNTRVEQVVPDGAAKRLLTTRGGMTAGHVMMGTGGYTDAMSPWHRRRIIPMSSTAIVTERIGRDRVAACLPRGSALIDTKRVIIFARPTPDGEHILFGGRARFAPVSAEQSIAIIHRQMCEVFPQLSDTKVLNTWSGFMAFTFDFLPKLGTHDGMHHAMACNGGAGIVMMSWLGRKAARNILGTANAQSAFMDVPFHARAFYRGNPWFVPIMGNWYRFLDWRELRRYR